MKLIYPAVFHHEDGSYWVELPDLPGCYTFGETVEAVFSSAKEALEGHCLTLLEDKKSLPAASSIESIVLSEGCFTSFVEVDISHYLNKSKAVKKTLTIPAWLNDLAVEKGINFSLTLQNALVADLGIVR